MSHMWGHALMDSAADIVLFTDAEVWRKYGEITKISALTCSFSFPQGVDGPLNVDDAMNDNAIAPTWETAFAVTGNVKFSES